MSADSGADDDDYVCGEPTDSTGEPCQFPVSGPDETCHNHPTDGSDRPDGVGSGDPGHSMGDGPGDIQEKLPDGAKPNMKHGIHAVQDDPSGTLRWIEDNDPNGYQWIVAKWRGYLDLAGVGETDPEADDILHVALVDYIVRAGRHQQVTKGLTEARKIMDEGEVVRDKNGDPIEIEQGLPINLPLNRLARWAMQMKKKLNLTDDPESQKADAMSWGNAAKRVAMKRDSQDAEFTESDDGT